MLGDLRYAIRRLIANPGFTAIALLILALGIGAATAVFSVADAALLRPLPGVANPERLVTLYRAQKSDTFDNFGYPDFADYRDRNRTLTGLAAHCGTPLSFRNGATERIRGDLVTGNYFEVLGVRPAIGRLIVPEDDRGAGNPVAVLSHDFWQRKFGGAPDVLGARIALNGFPFTVIGVARRGFGGTITGAAYDIWVPLSTQRQTIPRLSADIFTNRAAGWLEIFGRLKPGIPFSGAAADLDTVAHQLQLAYPLTNEGRIAKLTPGIGWYPDDRAEVSGLLQLLGGAVALFILMTCANLAGLFTVRAYGRQREIAVRLAVGAGKARLLRLQFAEGIVIAAAAGVAGLLLSGWTARLMASIRPSSSLRRLDLAVDVRVLSFAMATAVIAAIVFALLPALRSIPSDLVAPLKEASVGGGLRRSRLRSALIAAQVAISFILLAASALLVRNLQQMLAAGPGYETAKLALGSVDLTIQRYSEDRGLAIYRRLLETLPAIPGITSATLAGTVPPEEFPGRVSIFHPGEAPPPDIFMAREMNLGTRVDINRIAPGYFATLGIRILRGRDFTGHDAPGAPLVAIVSQALARQMWPNENPIGKHFIWPNWADPRRPEVEVIGIAADTRSRSLAAPSVPLMYVPLLQNYDGRARLVVRAAGDPAAAVPALARVLQSIDKDLPLYNVQTMDQHVADSLWAQRMAMRWISIFGCLALLLAAIGLYGVIAQSVSQRRRELGVRMALGAAPRNVVCLLLFDGVRLAVLGFAAGLPAALLLGRLLRRYLTEILPEDPLSFALAGLLLLPYS